jgi:GntR family transcriptional regulator
MVRWPHFDGYMAQTNTDQNKIDRSSSEPFYLQLSRLVERQITEGVFAVGDRLPSESELCRNFSLARTTVRESLRNLEHRGRIKMIPQRGAYVIDPEDSGWLLQVSKGFFENEANHLNRTVESAVLEARLTVFPKDAAAALSLGSKERGFLLKRLRKLDGQVALYSENYLLPSLHDVVTKSAIMQARGSLNEVLRTAGYSVFGARRSVDAVAADARLSELLQVPPYSPLLLVNSVSWNRDRRVFDYYLSWVRSDRVKITVEAQALLEPTKGDKAEWETKSAVLNRWRS